jgi:hypothetical protein
MSSAAQQGITRAVRLLAEGMRALRAESGGAETCCASEANDPQEGA